LSYSRWQKHFKDGNKRVIGDAWSWRPSTTVTDMNTDKVEQLLKEDRTFFIRELSGSLNVSLERVYHIVTVDLGMSWVCKISSSYQWWAEKKAFGSLPTKCNSWWTKSRLFIVHNHLWWVLVKQSGAWKHKDSPPAKKLCTAPSSGKVM
jgi:hypothetical protein